MNTVSNGHRKMDQTISDLAYAAKSKAEALKKQVLNQYSDAKDAVEDIDKQAHRHPWELIAKIAVASAAVGFCFGWLKRK